MERQRLNPRNFFIAFLLSTLLLLWTIYPFLYTIILALMLVGVAYPLYRRLLPWVGGRRHLASSFICLALFLGIFIPLVFLIITLSVEVTDFYFRLRQNLTAEVINQWLASQSIWVDRFNEVLTRANVSYSMADLQEQVVAIGKAVGLFMYDQTRALAGKMFGFTLHFIVMIVIIFFLLVDGIRLREYMLDIIPLPRRQEELLLDKFNDMTISIVIGNGVAAIIQGTLGGLFLTFFGIGSAVLWGTVMAIFAFIPFVGISIVYVPISIYLLVIGDTPRAVVFFVVYSILGGVVEYIFKPKLVGDRMKMHVLLVFLTILGGIATFGILGILFGPLVAIAFLTMAEMWRAALGKSVT
ncbi:MAG: AI-2E family transporter [Deltaproteobacteria bacterium]|nr:AI-2E family transporter [Candidatus Anaeroferrophillacea bacterium]